MIRRSRIAAAAIGGIGVLLATVLPGLLGTDTPQNVVLGLSVAGAALIWTAAIWDDTICRRQRDERVAEIHYRAGYNTALAFGALNGTLIFVGTNLDTAVSVTTIGNTLVAALVVYFGSVAWLKRSM